MKIYRHLSLANAKVIISLANKGYSRYKIEKIIGVSKGKIRMCLYMCEIKTIKTRYREPWKGPYIEIKYSSKIYQNQRNQRKSNRAYNYAHEAVKVYETFISFCDNLYCES